MLRKRGINSDFEGSSRLINGNPDIGAYEYH